MYSTSQLDSIITTLETALGTGNAEVMFEGRRIVYRTVPDIRNAIAYFRALYDSATDAPANRVPKIRTFLFNGSKGFGF